MSTPGSNALKAMQQINSNIVCFKKPQVKRKIKQKILTEDHYVEELAKIIQRDFYPDLERLNAQNEYLEAKEKNDLIKLRAIYAKYSGKIPFNSQKKNALGSSPATFETPMSIKIQTPRSEPQGESISLNSTASPKSNNSLSDNYSLDSFLSAFTSEDNNSFQNIIDAADDKLKKKFAVLFNGEEISMKKLTESLKLPSITEQFNDDLSRDINTWAYTNKNYIMYIPDGVEFTEEEKMNFAKNRQKIDYNNTRLIVNPFNETRNRATINDLANKQAKNFNGKIGVDGNTVETKNMSSTDVFNFVKTPSPCPGDICSPIMTWGEIGGTPFLLDGSDTPVRGISGPSFRISQTSRRENIALELAEKAGERMRSQKQTAINTARRNIGSPYIRSSIDRKMAMSPAAKKLATLKLGLRTSLMTPDIRTSKSLSKITKSTPSPIIKRKTVQIPQITKEKTFTNETNLTDDLLNIPSNKRIKASDFF